MLGVTEESPFAVALDESGNQQFASKMQKIERLMTLVEKDLWLKVVLIDADKKWSKLKK